MLVLVATLVGVMLGHGVLAGMVARLLGLPPKAVVLFAGRKLWKGRILGLPFELGTVPVISYVEFPPIDGDEGDDDGAKTTLTVAPRAVRLAIALVPWVLLVAPALVLLGPAKGAEELVLGFAQYPTGGFLFWSEGVALLDAIRETLATATASTVAGLAIVKLTAANLLPFPGNSGARALAALLPAGVERLLAPLGALMVLSTFGWVIAIVMWAIG